MEIGAPARFDPFGKRLGQGICKGYDTEKLTISAQEAYLLQRKTMIRKAKKHLELALHWIDRLRKLEKGSHARFAKA